VVDHVLRYTLGVCHMHDRALKNAHKMMRGPQDIAAATGKVVSRFRSRENYSSEPPVPVLLSQTVDGSRNSTQI
jgi:hypothetical protein